MHDVVIKGGFIADGTGAQARHGDIAIAGGRITEVGAVSGAARRTLDAQGLLVTPGFVDIHTHYDGQVCWDSVLTPSSLHGVTSAAMGNCGVGFAPARPDKHDWLIRLLEGVEDIPGTALAEGLTWDWESFPEYLNALSKRRYTMDIGAQLPHAPLRAYVMGDRGADHNEAPTEDEIERMEALTFEALQAGALGFSTTRTFAHRTRDGKNVGTLTASEAELQGITRALKRAGKGVIQLISDAYLSADEAFAASELKLIRALARETGRRLSFTVQQTDIAPDRWRVLFGAIDEMVAEGLTVRGQVAPRPVGVLLSFASTGNPFFATPTYVELAEGRPVAQRLAALRDPAVRSRILAEHAGGRLDGLMGMMTHGFERMFRMTDPVDYEPSPDASLAAEAERLGREAASHTYDVMLEEDGRRMIYTPIVNYAHGNLDDVHTMVTSRNALFGLSDGGAHCGMISDASFPTTTLALWSKGTKSGHKARVEDLVHGYSQRNARHVGWYDRGVLAPGYLGDVNVIDLEALSVSPPEIRADLPAGGSRLVQKARGYRWTVKAGEVTFENGEWTGALPGGLLRGEQWLA